MITLITGPGQHASIIIEQLKDEKRDFQFFRYWPDCRQFIYQKGKIVKERRFLWYDLLSFLLWGIANRMKFGKGFKSHIDWLYVLYDFLISFRIAGTNTLIAWPQVSLFSSRRAKSRGAKIILEYPLIHVEEWMKYMVDEYDKLKIPKNIRSNIFSTSMIRRMKEEIELSDEIIILSTFAKESFINNSINSSKLRIRQFEITKDEITPCLNNRDKFKVLFVGRVDILKGVQYLLEAYTQIKTKNTELVLVGTLSDEIKYFLEKYKDNSIKKMGVVPKNELAEIYREASVLVLPSIQESFGLVLLEAMQHKLPIIASKNTGTPDLQSKYPDYPIIIYDPFDVKELAFHLSGLIKSQK